MSPLKYLLLSLLLVSSSAQAGSILSGTVATRGPCKPGSIQVWLLQGRTVLYQLHVPKDGHFEMQAPAGEFTIVAASGNGCTAEQPVLLKTGETEQVKLTLTQAD